MARLACLFVLLGPAFAAADDLKAIAGYWKPVTSVANGTEQFPESKARDLITLKITPAGEYKVLKITDPAKDLGLPLFAANLKIDPATKGIEVAIASGPQKGQKCHGIYELKDGNLRLCYGPVDKPKPTKFEAPAGSFYFCETWTPEK